MSKRLDIQNHIASLLLAIEANEIEYTSSGVASIVKPVSPSSFYVNETSVQLAKSRDSDARRIFDKGWMFSCRINFDREADCQEAIEAAFYEVPRLALDKVYEIALHSVKYTHPPRQGPSMGGTVVDLVVKASPIINR